MNIDGSTLVNMTDLLAKRYSIKKFNPVGCYLGYCWSPDGKKLAFAHNGLVYVINVDGKGLTQLTHHGSDVFDNYPDWQPGVVKATHK